MKKLKAKIDAGFPAKPNLYKPVEQRPKGNQETDVWKKISGRWEYVIAKGKMYEVYAEKPSGELFEVETERISGPEKAGDSVERKKISGR